MPPKVHVSRKTAAVSIVIVNWNGKNDTVACLSSLRKMDKKRVLVEVVVVDNGSTDDSARVIGKAHPWVDLIETGGNLGFTGGNNVGIKRALASGADFIWLLNNDTLVHQDALSLLEAFAEKKVGIAGSKIYFAAGHEFHYDRYQEKDRGRVLWFAGGLIDWDNMYASHRGVDEVDRGQYDKEEETPFVTGCSMMIARAVFDKVGLLDERFYLYLEDLDFCLRAQKAGFRILYYPQSVIWHVNSGSTGRVGHELHDYYLTRNRLLVGFRYAPWRTKRALVREGLKMVLGNSAVKRKAVLDAFWGRWGKQYEPTRF